MNRKQLILLLVALVVLGGACLALLKRNQDSWNSSSDALGRKLFNHFQVNDVADIHIKGTTDLTLEKKNDRWSVRERDDYPANFPQISDLLIKMGDLKIAQSEPIGTSQLEHMHLAEPGKGANSAILLEFKDAQGKVLNSLLLGKKHMQKSSRPSPMPYGNDEYPDGRYVMLKSDPQNLLTVSDSFDSVEPSPAGWLDKTFFKVEKPESISFVSTNPADSWSLSRASESAPWVLADPKKGEVLDSNKVTSLSSSLGYPSFIDVVTGPDLAKTGMDKPLLVTIKTFDHFTYLLKVGDKNAANNYNLNVTVTANFPTERAPGKDEKPDDKKKLDKDFQDKLKPLQEKLRDEQPLAKWTYLVNTWLIDPVVRKRSDLMVEKRDEKKDEKKVAQKPAAKPDESGFDLPGLTAPDTQ